MGSSPQNREADEIKPPFRGAAVVQILPELQDHERPCRLDVLADNRPYSLEALPSISPFTMQSPAATLMISQLHQSDETLSLSLL